MTRVATIGADAIADIRIAADGRLRRRFITLGVIIAVLLAALTGATYLAWPRIGAWPWVQHLEAQMSGHAAAPSGGPASPAPVAPSSGSAATVPPTGDALVITGWSTWSSGDGGGAFAAQIMLRRETPVSSGQPGVYFLYPAASAAGFATVPVTYQGQDYRAVVTAASTWVFQPSNLATHADITCAEAPLTCSGTRVFYDPKATPDLTVPALVANAVSGGGSLRVLSAAQVSPGARKTECEVITCG